MYQTSYEYNLAIKNSIIQYKVRGSVDRYFFDESNVLKNSLAITKRSSNNNEVNIGSVYIGEFSIVLLLNLDPYVLKDKTISIECGVKIGANTWEWIPMGVFTIAEATKTKNGLSILAYDNMSKLDKSISEQVNGTAFEIASFACAQCGLTLANANFNNFVNHEQRLVEYPDNDIETFRDLMYWLAQTIGCFVTANRLGQIEFVSYGMDVVDTLDTTNRYNNGSFADYETWYTSINVDNIEDDSTSHYANPTDDGLNYNLGANPFLQFEGNETARKNVLSAISSFKYVPFRIESVANPAYDLGDVLSLPNGLGDASKKFCITQLTWKYNKSITISGGGKNPKLLSVSSSLEKQIKGIRKKQSDKDVIQYYSFTNSIDLLIEDGESVTIVDIRYASLKKANVIFNAEILCDVETTSNEEDEEATLPYFYNDAKAEFYYYLDNELIERIPAETWQDGDHIKHLLYYLNVEPGIMHHLEIKCEMSGGSALILKGAIKACLYGQNLVASDDWNGTIEIEQDVVDFELPTLIFGGVSDVVTFDNDEPESKTRTMEDGNTRITENGDTRITEGE